MESETIKLPLESKAELVLQVSKRVHFEDY